MFKPEKKKMEYFTIKNEIASYYIEAILSLHFCATNANFIDKKFNSSSYIIKIKKNSIVFYIIQFFISVR